MQELLLSTPISPDISTDEDVSRIHIAEYIASLLHGLNQMASKNNMPILAYLLDMAKEQAEEEIKR